MIAQFTTFFDYLKRKDLIFVPLENMRPDFGFCELPDRLPKFDLLGGILKIHGAVFGVSASVLE